MMPAARVMQATSRVVARVSRVCQTTLLLLLLLPSVHLVSSTKDWLPTAACVNVLLWGCTARTAQLIHLPAP